MLEHGVIGIGVDMCQISRMERSIQKQHFYERVFLEGERAYLERKEKSRVLSAAAMTYVAALAVAIMQLLRRIVLFGRRNND